MTEYTARITRVVAHGHDTRSLFLERPPGFTFEPGQFVSLQLAIDGARVTKPYTIASDPAPTEATLELAFNRVPGGLVSPYLAERTVGDLLTFTGPWGTFTCPRAPAAETVFIAEGLGIAAIRPMLHRAAATAAHPLHLQYATAHPLYLDELRALRGLNTTVVPPATVVRAVTARWIDADADRTRHFFVCGVGAMVLQLRDALRGAGYARRAVQYEKW